MIVIQQALQNGVAEQSKSLSEVARKPIDAVAPSNQACGSDGSGDIVVCGHADTEQFRLRPLKPPPQSAGFLHKPLRVQIAPGVTFGLQQGGGVGLKAEFGPGKKSADTAPD